MESKMDWFLGRHSCRDSTGDKPLPSSCPIESVVNVDVPIQGLEDMVEL